ncbi:MAG: hypothetical protein KA712_26010 [Myxococcales bacterium]|nr:hypothetical protein [Myxococcales bacterium]
MSPAPAPSHDGWPPGVCARFALLLWVTYAYFIAAPSWNPNAHFDLTLSLVEYGRLDIDPYHHNTGDKATHGGHVFSDKAPGLSFLAALPYAVFRAGWRALGGAPPQVVAIGRGGRFDAGAVRGDGDDDVLLNPSFRFGLYVATVFTSGLAVAALGGLLLALGRQAGLSRPVATAAAMGACLGTLLFPYATSLHGHAVAAALAFASFGILALEPPASRDDGTPPFRPRRLAWAGLCGGTAVTCEWPAALALAAVSVWVVARAVRPTGWRHVTRLWPFVGAAAFPLALALLYNTAAFGGPFRLGYGHLHRDEFAAGMGRGLFGIGWPSPLVMLKQTFGRSRGLFYTTPLLLFATLGLCTWRRRTRAWPDVPAVAGFTVVSSLFLSAGYYMWWGGAALGPRHVIFALPFWAMGLLVTWREPPEPGGQGPESRAHRWYRQGAFAAWSLSILNMLLGTAVGLEAPLTSDVLFRYVYPSTAMGHVPSLPGASNLGRLVGLSGALSLLPLVALWLIYISRVWPLFVPAARSRGPHE